MSDLIRREDAIEVCTRLIKDFDVMKPDGVTYEPAKVQRAAKGMVSLARQDIRALPAVQPGKEVMPDGTSKVWNHDAAPASTDDAGGGATREEVAEALWQADRVTLYSQLRPRFADIENYNRNHWLMMADVAIEKIKGGKK